MKVNDDDPWSSLPTKLVERLMPFQKEGVEFAIGKDGRCLIADEMGLGKTLQAICVAYFYRAEWPLLIIVPSSLRYCWIEEFEKWLPDINPGDINLVQSGTDISGISGSHVTITTYGLLSKGTSRVLREALMNQAFRVVIVDESHTIRNIKTASAKVIVPLIKNANRRILLSGTPALSRPVELYPQIDAIMPNAFGSWYAYTTRYCDAKTEYIGRVRTRNVNGASNLEDLQQKLSSLLMIRRQKDDVLTQLPPKVRQKILFDLKDSDLKKEIKQTFEELRPLLKRRSPENIEIVEGSGDPEAKDLNMLSMIQRLYQLSGEAKIGPAKEYTEMLCDNPNLKFLVFAYHKSMMNGLAQSMYDKDVKFIRIDGDTPPSERPQLVHQFQSDADTRVAILSILAAGVGLTFTAATLVVFAEMYWTPGMMIQCEDRAHRIGQSSSVSIHYLVAKDTMDEWVWSAVCKKTIVTSTTLTGRKQKMEALAGDSYQVDVLSNAEAWVPSNNEDMDLTGYFQTQTAPDQKSIRDFFSPSQSISKASQSPRISSNQTYTYNSPTLSSQSPLMSWLEGKKNSSSRHSDNPKKKSKLDPDSPFANDGALHKRSQEIVVIDSGSDADDFTVETPSANKIASGKRKRSTKNQKDGKKVISPKCNLVAAFQRVFKGNDSEVLSDEESGEVKMSKEDQLLGGDKQTKCMNFLPKVKASAKQWSCDVCTFLNHSALTKCEMCNSSKKPSAEMQIKDKAESDMSNRIKHEDNVNATVNSKDGDSKIVIGNSDDHEGKEYLETYHNTNFKDMTSQDTVKTTDTNIDPHKAQTPKNHVISDPSQDGMFLDVSSKGKSLGDSSTVLLALKTTENARSLTKTFVSPSGRMYRFKSLKKNLSQNKNHEENTAESPQGRVADDCNESIEVKSESLCDKSEGTDILMNPPIVGQQKNNEGDLKQDNQQSKEPGREQALGENAAGHQFPIYSLFRYQCSKYTGRIYVLDEADQPLNINFIPMDIEVGNHDNLPEVLLHPSHLRLVQKFVREWQSLTETKRRVIIKQGRSFISPLREYEDNKSCKTLNIQRHKTKIDTAITAMKKASEVSGTLRVITPGNQGQSSLLPGNTEKGITQVVAEDGTPLCVHCMKPYTSQLLKRSTIMDEENAWQTRFCSQTCAREYWMVSNNDYMRDQVFEAEHGICQLCKFDAHSFYRQIRDTKDLQKRAELITKSKFHSLCAKTKEQMVKKPVAGQFWHADHIIPVWQGGGQCDIDNLRTLCVTCHLKVSAQQAGQRATIRKLGSAAKSGNITAFFQKL